MRLRCIPSPPPLARSPFLQSLSPLSPPFLPHLRVSVCVSAPAAEPLKSIVDNFYMTDFITRASQIMSRATSARKAGLP